MKRQGLIIIGFFLFASSVNCNGQIKNKQLEQKGQIEAVEFVKSFLKWYKTQVHYINSSIHFVDINIQKPTVYKINYGETEKYLSILKSSGFFSEEYLNHSRDYFKKIDANFKKTKQDDGEPEGLDFDLVMHSQEPESLLQNLNNIQLTISKEITNGVIVKLTTKFDKRTYSLFTLSMKDTKYLIDKIEFINP